MKIDLPKELRSYHCSTLFQVDMGGFDAELLLPSLFFAVRTGGRGHSKTNDPTAISDYLDRLAKHPNMHGFDEKLGRTILEKWVRTSLISTGKIGKIQKGEQIQYVQPWSLLCYKTGFPADSRHLRNVHRFIYQAMCSVIEAQEAAKVHQDIFGLFRDAFGKGLHLDGPPDYDGRYDEQTKVDLQTLLCLYFLDGFNPTPVRGKELLGPPPILPAYSQQMALDLLLFLQVYAHRLPQMALIRSFMALMSLWLFIYTLKLIYAANELARQHQLPLAMADRLAETPPELYVDFTRLPNTLNDEMARACVERDLAELPVYVTTGLTVLTLERYVNRQGLLKEPLEGKSACEYLTELLKLQNHPKIQAYASVEFEGIQKQTLESLDPESDPKEITDYFENLQKQFPGNDLLSLMSIISEVQSKQAIEDFGKWFRGSAAINQPYGILSGNLRGPRNWRYAMGSDLLSALVYLCAVCYNEPWPFGKIRNPRRVKIIDFLAFLRRRFGILIDRPPQFKDSTEARAASQENLAAFKQNLRQMGFFEELSDDFTAQYIQLPQEISG